MIEYEICASFAIRGSARRGILLLHHVALERRLAKCIPPNWLSHPSQVEITEAAPGESLDGEEQNNISVYKRNIPSVVNVTSRAMTFDFFYGLVPQEGQGSGFVIDKDGHILTNYHVIADARQVEVTLHNRKKYKATVIGTDPPHDLAVIQIKAPDLVPAVLGDSRQSAGRAKGLRHRQSVRPGGNHDARNCELDSPGAANRTAPRSTRPFRPMRPSIPAIPAARS